MELSVFRVYNGNVSTALDLPQTFSLLNVVTSLHQLVETSRTFLPFLFCIIFRVRQISLSGNLVFL